jgi:hypothetical protein
MNREERIEHLRVEAERLRDRLNVMNAQIDGDQDAWLHLTTKMPDTVAEVYVDKVLAEARQHALAYATVVKTLESLEGAAEQAPAVDVADEMAKRRAEKLAKARTS